MASEENQETQVVAPAPNPTLPPYPEIIIAAIKELNEKEGSNKTSITKQIETTYPDLHPANQTLVAHHLDQMKASGQVTFVKNNYLIADPTSPAPQKRGRGRPPKAKTLGEAPKAKTGGSSVPGRKRGRPAKVTSGEGAKVTSGEGVEKSGGEVKRGRGRPPKVKEGDVVSNAAAAPVGA